MADRDTVEEYSPAFWLQELEREGKRGGNKWRKRARKVVDRYRDERAEAEAGQKKFNILYSNIETLKPAISGRTPQPTVQRRFAGDDPPTRIAGEVIQKTLKFCIDDYDFDHEKERARDDGLIAGRGVLWVDYKSKITRRYPELAPSAPSLAAPAGPPAPVLPPDLAGFAGPAGGAGGAPPMGMMAPPGGGLPPMDGMGMPPPPPTGGPGMGLALPGGMMPPALGPASLAPQPDPMAAALAAPPPAPPIGGQSAGTAALGAAPPAPQYILDGQPVEIDGIEEKTGKPYVDEVTEEWVRARHVLWRDFRHTPVNDWRKVWWVAVADYLTKKEARDEFGKEKADKLVYASPGAEDESSKDDGDTHREPGRALIWRFWCKWDEKIYTVTEGFKDECIKIEPAPFEVDGFFPCEPPYRPIGTTDRWEPIPEYCIYQDQAEEIDNYTVRINKLTTAIKARGAAPAVVANALADLNGKGEGEIGPIEDFESLADANGGAPNMQNSVIWQPIEQFAKVLEVLVKARGLSKQELYEITGISDLMRQSTAASETATAQQLKGNFGQMRLQPRQAPFERFIKGTFRIMAEVIAEKFSRRTLEKMTGLKLGMTGDPVIDDMGAQVMQLLRDDRLRAYRVDVETDTLIAPDEQAEKASTIEYVGAITKFLEGASQIAIANPKLIPMLMEMLKQASRRFKLGRELEEIIDKTVQDLKELADQPIQPPPNPDLIKAEAEAGATKADVARKDAETQAKLAAEAAQRQREQAAEDQAAAEAEVQRQAKLIEAQAKAQAEADKAARDAEAHALEQQRIAEKHAADLDKQKRELALAEAESRRKDAEHAAKEEERIAKRTIDDNTVAETGAKRKHAEETAAVSQEIVSTVKALSEAVKGLSEGGETEAMKGPDGKWRIRKIKAPAGRMN